MPSGPMYSAQLSRLLAVPVLAAGILSSVTVGEIATARADDDNYQPAFGNEPNYVPSEVEAPIANEYANPASTQIPWDPWVSDGLATVPQVDIPGL